MFVSDAYGTSPHQFLKPNPKRKQQIKEGFILPTTIISDPAKLDSTKYYTIYKLNSNVNITKTPSLYGGTNCTNNYPQQVYQLYTPTASDAATGILTNSTLYILDTSTTTCQLSYVDYNIYRVYRLKDSATIDSLTGGVTTKQAQYGGQTLSQIVNANPTLYPSTKLLGTPCAPVNATCTTDMTKIYTVDPGISETTCSTTTPYTDYDPNQNLYTRYSYFRPFSKASASVLDSVRSYAFDSSFVTTVAAQNGGLTCSAQIAPTSTSYPATMVASTSSNSPNYCPPVNCPGGFNGTQTCYYDPTMTPTTGKGNLYGTWVSTGFSNYGGSCPSDFTQTAYNQISSGVCTVPENQWPCTYDTNEVVIDKCKPTVYRDEITGYDYDLDQPIMSAIPDYTTVAYTTYGYSKIHGPLNCSPSRTTRRDQCTPVNCTGTFSTGTCNPNTSTSTTGQGDIVQTWTNIPYTAPDGSSVRWLYGGTCPYTNNQTVTTANGCNISCTYDANWTDSSLNTCALVNGQWVRTQTKNRVSGGGSSCLSQINQQVVCSPVNATCSDPVQDNQLTYYTIRALNPISLGGK